MEQPESQVPYSTSYISEDFIPEYTRRTLPEVLQYTPGVLVQKTAYGHGSPYIRGFTGRQNLLLVDGIRVNNSTYRSGPIQYWNTVDVLDIDHIELTKSQGSVLYGSAACITPAIRKKIWTSVSIGPSPREPPSRLLRFM